jgi:hypothetical protein
MRDYAREIISNTVFREEYFSNIDNAIADFRSKENFEAVVQFKTIKRKVKNYIDLIEG